MKFQYDYSKLLGRIIEKFGTRDAFCKAYGISNSVLSEILLNKRKFPQNHMKRMASPEFLDIPLSEYGEYFFKLDVLKNEN